MLTRQALEYIEKMREEEFVQDEFNNEETGDEFVSSISSNIAHFFNHIICSINLRKVCSDEAPEIENKNHCKPSKSSKLKSLKNQAGKITTEKESNVSSLDRKESNTQREDNNQQQIQQIKEQDNQIFRSKDDKIYILPKKPVSSFFMYYQDHSKDATAKLGEVGGSRLAKDIAQTWNNLLTKQKQPYFKRAEEDKQRYRNEMSNFFQDHADEIEDIKLLQKMKKMKQKMGKKDGGDDQLDSDQGNLKIKGISQRQMKAADRKNYSHRPKAPVSSFFIFYQEEAKNIAIKNGETVGSKIAKLASECWKQMSESDKQKYQQAAQIERQRYRVQMIQYKIDYPDEIESRRKKISNSMKRALKMGKQLQKEAAKAQSSQSLSNLSDDSSGNSHKSSPSSNSSESSEDEEQEKRAMIQPEKPTKRQKKEKENPMPHKPKGAICSFFQYYHAHMQQFMKKEGESQKDAGSELVRRASVKWKELSKEEKEVYHQMARVDRKRFQKDMNHFKETYPEEYEIFQEVNRNKQLKNKKKRQAKLQDLKELDIDDIMIEQ